MLDLSRYEDPRIVELEQTLLARASELRRAYADDKNPLYNIPEMEATFQEFETEYETLTGVRVPPPTDAELKDAFKEKRLEEERLRLAREKAEQELRNEGKLPPLPAPVAEVDPVAQLEAEAKQQAAIDTLAETLYDEARLDFASQIFGLSVDETVQLLKDEIVQNSAEPDPLPEPEQKVSLFQRLTGGA